MMHKRVQLAGQCCRLNFLHEAWHENPLSSNKGISIDFLLITAYLSGNSSVASLWRRLLIDVAWSIWYFGNFYSVFYIHCYHQTRKVSTCVPFPKKFHDTKDLWRNVNCLSRLGFSLTDKLSESMLPFKNGVGFHDFVLHQQTAGSRLEAGKA